MNGARLLLLASTAALLSCSRGPAPEELQAALGGVKEADVRGVVRVPDGYLVTGRCTEPRGHGVEVLVAPPPDQPPTVQVLAARAKHLLYMECAGARTRELEIELEAIRRRGGR